LARILLIEDQDLVRSLLRDTLEHAGHTVIEARNGVEGLDLFRQAGADLVITDIVMPHKGGLGVVTALREQVPPVSIIAISGARDSAEGHIIAGDGLIKVEPRCEACGVRFLFVRKPLV